MNVTEYIDNIKEDCIDYIEENLGDYDDFDELYGDMQMSVTGNADGSYYCNAIKAEKALADVLFNDEVNQLCKDLGYANGIPMEKGPEACDVIVRVVLMDSYIYNWARELWDSKQEEKEELDKERIEKSLKTCPFCDGHAYLDALDSYYEDRWYVTHDSVDCPVDAIETPCFKTMQEAADAWNTRHGEEK